MWCVWVLETKSNVCPIQNRLCFITETEPVYCAVGTGSLNKKDYVLSLRGTCKVNYSCDVNYCISDKRGSSHSRSDRTTEIHESISYHSSSYLTGGV
jgi:hypothetical protein